MDENSQQKAGTKLNLGVWKRLLPYLKITMKHMLLAGALMLLSSLAESTYPQFTSYAVNRFVVTGETKGLPVFALLYFLVIAASGVAVIIYSRQSIIVEMELNRHIKMDCFVHLQELPFSYYNQNSVGFILARVMSDTGRISSMIAWGVVNLLWCTSYVIFALVNMFILNWKLGLILLCIIPVIGVITYFFEGKILRVNRQMRAVNSRIIGAYNEGITGAKTSKTLVIEDKNCKEFSGITGEMYKVSVHSTMLSAALIPIVLFFSSMAVAAVLYKGGYMVMDEVLNYGVLSAFISYAVAIVDPIQQVASMLTEIVAAQANIERITALLDEPCTIVDSPEVVEKYGGTFNPKKENWEPIKGDIEFKNVWFKYPDGDEYVLEDFSLKIPAGTNVAIVGETGAGKSTLVNLACRFFEPTRGEILIDGVDYRERSQLWLHSSLGYVLQTPHLFSGTVKENIRYGNLDATDEMVCRAAEMVSADTVAKKLPQGYDTDVGEGGDRLSTGEKQLISFARAIIADPPIFVLDEATSSIDTETELLIQNAISHILKGRTSFIIAHRLSTIRHADLILVVSGGKIIERGTHDSLMAAGGYYKKLYTAMQIQEKEEQSGL